jgi:hypothetical protein
MSIRHVTIFGVLFSLMFFSSMSGMAATPAAGSSNITIGDTQVESADDDGNGNLVLAQGTTLPQTATIQTLSFYVTKASGDLILGIYDATGSNGGPGALKAYTCARRTRTSLPSSRPCASTGCRPVIDRTRDYARRGTSYRLRPIASDRAQSLDIVPGVDARRRTRTMPQNVADLVERRPFA